MNTKQLTRILNPETNITDRHVKDFAELTKIIQALRKQKKKIVLTQGVYDLIHEGHVLYLEKAKQLGDILIVGVDSDELTRARKGPNRPIVPEGERIKMLVHLRHVDIVFVREMSHDLGDLIRTVKPDVLVTSTSTKDFTEDQKKIYKDYVKKIVTFPPQATTSTTARIRTLTIEGAEELARQIKKLTQNFIAKIRKSS
jgi:D-beta-D-heptose 7-phosphate kinase/D-beta-D-heptose 1-phosphate adenosyltransferase